MVDFQCGKCDHKFSVPAKYAGKRIRCKQCSHINTVPGGASPKPSQNNKEMDLSLDFMDQDNDVFQALLKHEKEAPSVESTE
jgi:hypothetical protein